MLINKEIANLKKMSFYYLLQVYVLHASVVYLYILFVMVIKQWKLATDWILE